MKPLFTLVSLATVLILGARAASGQFAPPRLAPGGARGGFQLAQQPGIFPGGGGAFLMPGQSIRLALFCVDLFAATPDHRTRMVAPQNQGQVRLASGPAVTLHDALENDWLLIRGRGPGDPPRMDGRAWFDAYLTNTSGQPLKVEWPAGLLLVPAGQPAPKLPAGIDRMLAAAAATRRIEADAPAYAVWAARGFTRADIEQTTMRRVTDGQARQVQRWLDEASLPHRFDRDADEYDRLYQQAAAKLTDARPLRGTASLAAGGAVAVSGRHAPDGRAVVTLTSPRGGVWRYAARVEGESRGKLELTLHHLKTGLPLEANGGRIRVAVN